MMSTQRRPMQAGAPYVSASDKRAAFAHGARDVPEQEPRNISSDCFGGVIGTSTLLAPPPPPPIVRAPISWAQLGGALLSDYLNPAVILAFLGVVANWLQSSESVTTKGIITVIVLALIAAMQAALHVTETDGLARRLRAMGQIEK
jgi:hypothetical protein